MSKFIKLTVILDEEHVEKYTNVDSIHNYYSYGDETWVTVYDAKSDTDSGLKRWNVAEKVEEITKLIG